MRPPAALFVTMLRIIAPLEGAGKLGKGISIGMEQERQFPRSRRRPGALAAHLYIWSHRPSEILRL